MKLSCEIIRDILPLYHDGVCSEESRAAVSEHLQQCELCRKELRLMDGDGLPPVAEPPEKSAVKAAVSAWKRGKKRAFIKGAAIALAVVLAVAAIWNLCFVSQSMMGRSMEPTITDGELCLFSRLSRQPERGDVVLVSVRLSHMTHALRDIVRVAALPGDRVYIEDGTLYVNDEPSEYFQGEILPADMEGEITLGEDEYFVMGDNHEDALDSRDDRYGPVQAENILGICALPVI